ncbi:MAG: hypothetical protein COV01_03425 [Candidatus Taylorbacteria bacterium CG10_big_fil_rev_8_21_14_0_10_41_48]|uniref:Uncharacterized protein n=1 Tax=Candidatus Taylorbacteria bacterium CG10_big_fil_rev_8_21_14_0_10_41_48 TaxID=1975024 RepID=A0A2M8LBA2_9BACT|nr:MAG: hypothetical protein COV01_03425 [Candidatus Taylorbacteria bacterium CG10_big_fil_rev_8_21_14_0_10_41_48]
MLSPEAQKTIESYINLPIGAGCVTPYFNNRRKKIRGGLRALIGKGSPKEIVEEAEIVALREKADLKNLDSVTLKKFLVDKNLGIDCSGFAFHVLNAESLAVNGKRLGAYLTSQKGFLRRFISRFREAENISVSHLVSEENSTVVNIQNAQSGDIITLLNSEYNHVVIIESVEHNDANTTLHYIHSYAWPEDGVYGHGIHRGTLTLSNENIMRGTWIEDGHVVNFEKKRPVEKAELRRLKAFI